MLKSLLKLQNLLFNNLFITKYILIQITIILNVFFCIGSDFSIYFTKNMNFAIICLNKLFKQINFVKLMANLDSAMPRYP